MDFQMKERYAIDDLIEIVRLLRSENGCPWDKEQTHKSIRKNMIEETYEVCEAIDKDDAALLREELGDVLLQVALHSQMEDEKSVFSFDDVANDICQKLIVRHPHVFSDTLVTGVSDVLENWSSIKQQTKGQTKASETLLAVPRQLPALMRSEKVLGRAKKAGSDLVVSDPKQALFDLKEQIDKLAKVIDDNSQAISDEIGMVLLKVVGLSHCYDIDAEEAMEASCDRFITEFVQAEESSK